MQQAFFIHKILKGGITQFLLWKIDLFPFPISQIFFSAAALNTIWLWMPKKLIIIFLFYIYFSTFLGISFPQKGHGQKNTFLLQLLYRRFQWGKVHVKYVQIRLQAQIKFWCIYQYLIFNDTCTSMLYVFISIDINCELTYVLGFKCFVWWGSTRWNRYLVNCRMFMDLWLKRELYF